METILHTESSTGWGGQEIRILTEIQWLVARGWHVLLACQPGSRVLQKAQEAEISVHSLPMRYPMDPAAILALRRLIREHGVRLVHTHSSLDTWCGAVAARLTGRPVIRSRHVSIGIRHRWNPIYGPLVDRIIASGHAVEAALRRAGVDPAKIVSIPAGVDLARFNPAVSPAKIRQEFGLGWPVIGVVAMFRSSKGHQPLLGAFQGLLDSYPKARLLLVGDGVYRSVVEAEVSARGLWASVTITGFRTDVPECLAAMDCVVLPSLRSEGVPQSLLQAMAMGRPIVATAIGGIPEVIEDGQTGLLVPPSDTQSLMGAIRRVLEEPDSARARSQRGLELVRTRFSLDASLGALEDLYRDLLTP